MTEKVLTESEEKKSVSFIEQMVINDLAEGKNGGRFQTRFPPEPNGYLHIGHAKAIAIDFGLAKKYGGECNLRFDDTNPVKEDTEYIENIEQDIKWLGFEWGNVYYASDYFQQLWDFAVWLIKQGRAYVDEQSSEMIAQQKGTTTSPGTNSPYRDRPVEENLRLFEFMNSGKCEPGTLVLRAKIDMAHPNMLFRDPLIYRVLNIPHVKTGSKWNAYPMYDFTHGQSDYLEGVTHSWCTLEFVEHRPLYDLFVNWMREWVASEEWSKDDNIISSLNSQLSTYQGPRQTEFNKLNLNYILLSKRNLRTLVSEGLVNGWDDPRMPTICGFRRRGYTPESIKAFCDRIGVAKRDNIIDYGLLEFSLREHLNKVAQRRMVVLDPVKVIIDNYPEGETEMLTAVNNPECEADGTRQVPFGRELFIEREDFMEVAPKKYFRMAIGQEVRLRYAYFVTAQSVEKDADGNITCIHCTYDPATRGGDAPDGRKVKGTIHWVSAQHAIDAEVRLFDRLFAVEAPDDVEEGHTFLENINPNSLKVVTAKCEPSLKNSESEIQNWNDGIVRYQFERMGYFCTDKDSTPEHLVFNRTSTLKDSWAKIK